MFWKNIKNTYKNIFCISEIKSDAALQFFGGAILLGFLLNFNIWEGNHSLTLMGKERGISACWPFFQNCTDWYFMVGRPFGYVQNTIFMTMLGVIFTGAYALLSRKFTLAHSCILILFLWQAFIMLMSYRYISNYFYYHIAFCLVFLFLPHKRFFASFTIVFFYFLSTATKIHESWTLGTYFSSLQNGLPLFPDSTIMIWTNIVIFIEMIGAWFLFSKNKILQRTIFSFFVLFHLYSGVFVSYHYPLIATPPLIIFFGTLYKPFKHIPLDRKSILGWMLCFLFFYLQMISHMIPGDEKMTLEGNFYGHYMFDANHQCIISIQDQNNNLIEKQETVKSGRRCDPYLYWFQAKLRYCHNHNNKYRYTIHHSINGGPLYEIVNEPDMCALTYYPFYHNDWIKTEEEATPIGRPRKNHY